MSELTPSQEQAIKLLDSGLNVFLTGKAGTGKSYLVDHFVDKHPEKSIIKCAPTGVAALKIGYAAHPRGIVHMRRRHLRFHRHCPQADFQDSFREGAYGRPHHR